MKQYVLKTKEEEVPPKVEKKPRKKKDIPARPQDPRQQVEEGPSEPVVQPVHPLSLRVAIVGAPNAGKSSLLNILLAQKVSAVSPKAQTTRSQILGVMSHENVQITFIDTPGIVPIAKQKTFIQEVVTGAWKALYEADMGMLILDVLKKDDKHTEYILQQLERLQQAQNKKLILVINKADLVSKDDTVKLAEQINKRGLFSDIFIVSAASGMNVRLLKDFLVSKAVPREWDYNSNTVTPMSKMRIAAEVIREKLFLRFNQEIPYIVRQSNRGWITLPNGEIIIEQVLHVPKESQKAMVIGTEGKALKFVSMASAEELSRVFNTKVHLYLFVKIMKDSDEENLIEL